MAYPATVPARAWIVTFAGTAVNLCLGILYAWSVWKAALVPSDPSLYGTPMNGVNEGWTYLSDAQGTWAYAICGFTFALFMIPGGRIHDRYGPKAGATLGGLCLAAGCVLTGLMKSYQGLIVGFGLLGGIGMGLGYAAATPAAVRWFHSSRRGLVVGLVVAGYGAAAIYISPLADFLIRRAWPHRQFCRSWGAIRRGGRRCRAVAHDCRRRDTLFQSRHHVPVALKWLTPTSRLARCSEPGSSMRWSSSSSAPRRSGLLVIANAKSLLKSAAGASGFFADNAWLLATFGGFLNAAGRIGTGQYSDRIGRLRSYALNGLVSAACLFAAPWVIGEKSVLLLFVVIGVMFWQYGGTLAPRCRRSPPTTLARRTWA